MSFSPSPEFETFIRDFITSHATTIFSAFPPPSDQTTDPQQLIFTVYSNLLQNKEQPLPASKAAIDALPTVTLTVTEQEEECAICLTALCSTEIGLTEEGAKEMPCKHRYHADCIKKWLCVSGSCPVCRYDMPVDEEEEKRRRDGGFGWQVTVTVASGGSVNDSDLVDNMDIDLDSGGNLGQGSMEDLD